MPDHFHCTYCGDTLAETATAGDELPCEGCGVTFDLVTESEVHNLVVYVCPYCGTDNKRDRGVETVRCENDDRVDDRDGYQDDDCGLVFDPAGAETRAVDPAEERVKMVLRQGGDA